MLNIYSRVKDSKVFHKTLKFSMRNVFEYCKTDFLKCQRNISRVKTVINRVLAYTKVIFHKINSLINYKLKVIQ